MNFYSERLYTFYGKLTSNNHIYSAQMMALAGFEYLSPKDAVSCSACCFILDNLAERDVAFAEHLLCTSVKCNFIDMSGVPYVTENITLCHTRNSSTPQRIAKKGLQRHVRQQ